MAPNWRLCTISLIILLAAAGMQHSSTSSLRASLLTPLQPLRTLARKLLGAPHASIRGNAALHSSSATPPAAASAAGGGQEPAAMPSVRHLPASGLKVSKPTWWLESRFHFSFAEYYDPGRSE